MSRLVSHLVSRLVSRLVSHGVPSRLCPPQEKEQHSLCSQAEGLQEEVSLAPGVAQGGQRHGEPTPALFPPRQNQRLLAEGQGLREQIQVQAARMASLEVSTVATVATVGGAGG